MLAAQAVDTLPCSHLADTNDAISFDPNVLSLRESSAKVLIFVFVISITSTHGNDPLHPISPYRKFGKMHKKKVSNVHLRSARSLRCCQVAAFLVSGIRVQACFQAVIPCHVRSCSKLRGQNPTNLWQLVYFPQKKILYTIYYFVFIFYIIYVIFYRLHYILYMYNVKYYILFVEY